MTTFTPPFDDTFQLDDMEVDFSDTAPIVRRDPSGSQISDNECPVQADTVPAVEVRGGFSTRGFIAVLILTLVNLLNYMDRFTIAGVLKDIQDYYDLTNSEDGIIQTAFILSYMVLSPIFGFLGDRWTRKYIMCSGIFFWSCVTLAGSFVPKQYFSVFVFLRALVGVGEASYSTIAPTIIADLFHKDMRTKMLMIFYFAIPVGSGLGYIVGSNVAKLMHDWKWALRVTPVLGVVCVCLLLFVVQEPKRGESEGGTHLRTTSYITDLKYLVKNKSFILSTLGFTCVAFVTGALALWAPIFMMDSIRVQGKPADEATVSLIFGVITVLAGFFGVACGAQLSQRLKKKFANADPLICAFGMIMCSPFLFLSLLLSRWYTIVTYILIFFGELMLFWNWSIVADMLLYVVIPTRRSTAESFQILLSHALGDATSPYLIGVIADALANGYKDDPQTPSVQFPTLQYSLYLTTFICVIGGGFFLAASIFIKQDRAEAEKITKGVVDEDSFVESMDGPIVLSYG